MGAHFPAVTRGIYDLQQYFLNIFFAFTKNRKNVLETCKTPTGGFDCGGNNALKQYAWDVGNCAKEGLSNRGKSC